MPTSRTSCPRTHTGPHVGFPGGIRTSRGFPSGQATEARRQPGRPPVAPHQSSDHTSRPISVCPRAQPCPPAPARHSRSKTKLRPPPLLTATCHIPGRAPDSRASPWPKPGSSSPPSPGPAHAAVGTRLSDVGAAQPATGHPPSPLTAARSIAGRPGTHAPRGTPATKRRTTRQTHAPAL